MFGILPSTLLYIHIDIIAGQTIRLNLPLTNSETVYVLDYVLTLIYVYLPALLLPGLLVDNQKVYIAVTNQHQ